MRSVRNGNFVLHEFQCEFVTASAYIFCAILVSRFVLVVLAGIREPLCRLTDSRLGLEVGRRRAPLARANAINLRARRQVARRCDAALSTWLALDNCNCRSTAEATRDELSLRVVSIRLGCSSGGATSTVPETCRRAHCDVRIWLPRGVISGIDVVWRRSTKK